MSVSGKPEPPAADTGNGGTLLGAREPAVAEPVGTWAVVRRFPITRIAAFGTVVLILYVALSLGIERIDRLGYRYWAEPLSALGALWLMGRWDGISLAGFGLANRWAAVREIVFGFGIGALTMSIVVGIMAAFGWYRGHIEPVIPVQALQNSLGIFLAIAIFEEIVYRGYFFQTLERHWGSDAAFAATMVTFGLMHLTADIPGGSMTLRVIGALSIAVEAGILFAAAYLLTRRLWMPIGLHWAWNFFQGPIFGAPVTGSNTGPSVFTARIGGPEWATGGQFGPEASIPALLVGTVIGLTVLWLAVRRRSGERAAHGLAGRKLEE
jgi:membrane protease YdiL (CAAX protease family)